MSGSAVPIVALAACSIVGLLVVVWLWRIPCPPARLSPVSILAITPTLGPLPVGMPIYLVSGGRRSTFIVVEAAARGASLLRVCAIPDPRNP